MSIVAIVQCRMTSTRYPGKVLAPFMGKPLLVHVVARLREFDREVRIVLATSEDLADDPLALYAGSLGLPVFRGPRDDVLGRFVLALEEYPCDALFRVCGDSPLLNPALFSKAISVYESGSYDVVTNVFPRTFPVGMSVELLRKETFIQMSERASDPDDREHVTRYFYQYPEQFRIYNIECSQPADPALKLSVDEIGDLKVLEQWLMSEDRWACPEFKWS